MARNMRRFYEMFHVPADPGQYYFVLAEEMPDPLQGVIGYVFNDSFDGVQIALEVDEEYLESKGVKKPLLYVDPENYLKGCCIVMTRSMVKRLQKGTPDILFQMWHEVGHFHTLESYTQEYMTYELSPSVGYTAEQYAAIVSGEVMAYEAAADDFGVRYCGPEAGIISMNGLIAILKSETCGPEQRGLIQDLLNRKKRILEMRDQKGAGNE